ncbi:MAG: ABC transporter substrate-binding protein [Leptolyngbyaceae cyanobacterium RU_5_1]|nr:ABC transporter substrate-binding protein [Leptolyngbyaceae cyanobacterium RU_5_1]
MRPNRFRSALLFSITLLFLAACTLLQPAKQELPPLRFGYSAWVGYFPIAIAQEKGFFAEQGVPVQLSYSIDAQAQDADFGAGKLDGMTIVLGDVIRFAEFNPNVRIVLMIDESEGADAVVAKPEVQAIADLKGKTIAAQLGGFGELFVTRMLEANSLTSNDVKLVNAYGDKVPNYFKSGDIQAGHTWEPYISQLTKTGARILFTSKQTPGLISDVIAFHKSILQERPDDIRAFLRAWDQAVDYWQAHPDEGAAIISKATKVPIDQISLEGVKLHNRRDNLTLFTARTNPGSLYSTVKLYSDFYLRKGSLTRPLDVNQLLDSSFLK